jgi:uncharacterized protein (TIGR00730 family)
MPIRAVTVYCSSSSRVPQVYFDAAAELGAAIARQGWTLVYGGNAVGCMAALADAARANRGKVIGVTPEALVEKGISDGKCDELIVTQTMRERKALMESKGDAFLTLPGGLGTFEEIFEIIVARQLGYHDKPIVLLNIAGYYDPLLAMLDHGIEQQFIKPAGRELIHVTATVADAIGYLRSHPTAAPPPSPEPSSALE